MAGHKEQEKNGLILKPRLIRHVVGLRLTGTEQQVFRLVLERAEKLEYQGIIHIAGRH